MLHAPLLRGRQRWAAALIALLVFALMAVTARATDLTVTKTATASHTRSFDWSIAKQATPASITTSSDTATYSYTVTVTKSQPIDSGFTVSGGIAVRNDNAFAISGVTVTDQVGGTPCTVGGNPTNATIPAKQTVTFPYTCAVSSAASGTNVATAVWPGHNKTASASFTFGAPTTVVNDTVDVTDAFNGAAPALLAGGDDLNHSAVLTYTRTVAVPASGCLVFPNVAAIASASGPLGQATAQVEACRAQTVTVTGTQATPSKLTVTKRGPARAAAGQVVIFTLVVRNTSNTTARSVQLADVLPAGYTVYKRPYSTTFQRGRLVWRVGDLAAGARKIVKVQVRLDRAISGRRCNTAVASAGNAPTVSARACTTIARVAGVIRVPIVTG